MGARNMKVLQQVSGWKALELVCSCIFYGLWQMLEISLKGLWKGRRRKSVKNPSVELTVDASIGTHCYIKVLGVKYHYVETGPKSGQTVLVLKDAPDCGHLSGANWSNLVQKLAETDHHVITLDLRGTGGSEGGSRRDFTPPRVVEELSTLMKAVGVSESRRAVVIGFGIGGMLTWYLVHTHGNLVSKFAVIGAPHPNLYWQYPPAAFCQRALHFIQWPFFPERWLAESELNDSEGRWGSSRACDWTGALNYVRGAGWWRVSAPSRTAAPRTAPPGLLVGTAGGAAALVASAAHCADTTLRLVPTPTADSEELVHVLLEFLIVKEKPADEEVPRGLMGRMFGAVAERGRHLTARGARLILSPTQA